MAISNIINVDAHCGPIFTIEYRKFWNKSPTLNVLMSCMFIFAICEIIYLLDTEISTYYSGFGLFWAISLILICYYMRRLASKNIFYI